MTRRCAGCRTVVAVVLCACVLVSGCGVDTQDEPQLIEESTPQPMLATPSFDTEPSPVTVPPDSTTTSVSVTTSTRAPAPAPTG